MARSPRTASLQPTVVRELTPWKSANATNPAASIGELAVNHSPAPVLGSLPQTVSQRESFSELGRHKTRMTLTLTLILGTDKINNLTWTSRGATLQDWISEGGGWSRAARLPLPPCPDNPSHVGAREEDRCSLKNRHMKGDCLASI